MCFVKYRHIHHFIITRVRFCVRFSNLGQIVLIWNTIRKFRLIKFGTMGNSFKNEILNNKNIVDR